MSRLSSICLVIAIGSAPFSNVPSTFSILWRLSRLCPLFRFKPRAHVLVPESTADLAYAVLSSAQKV
jgi:hypothetical protein